MIMFNGRKTSNACSNIDTHTVRLIRIHDKLGIIHRLLTGGNGKMDKGIHLFYFFFLNKRRGIKFFDLPRNLHRILTGIKSGNGSDSGLAFA